MDTPSHSMERTAPQFLPPPPISPFLTQASASDCHLTPPHKVQAQLGRHALRLRLPAETVRERARVCAFVVFCSPSFLSGDSAASYQYWFFLGAGTKSRRKKNKKSTFFTLFLGNTNKARVLIFGFFCFSRSLICRCCSFEPPPTSCHVRRDAALPMRASLIRVVCPFSPMDAPVLTSVQCVGDVAQGRIART